ncbi:class I adenylate-forming enzyme family protein [Sphingomonas sp. ASV193]|uniref:class I adenylate-forming enzyme family protein n=1 Tax=Sphingomonas sp. ASV193 TaxID=3144405 RepID=UPI0032E8F9F9
MGSELDRLYDESFARLVGPGGRLTLGKDGEGRTLVTNLPPTLPAFFKTFCALNGAKEALVAGEERLSFADLDRLSDRLAAGLAGRGIAKGERVGIAMRNCPSWIVAHMAIVKAGAIAVLLNGWWQAEELDHALALTAPALVLADAPRALRVAQSTYAGEVVTLPIEKPVEEALAGLLGDEAVALPEVTPDDDATILFTSGSTGEAKGAVSTHRAVTMGVYTYAASILTLLGILEATGRPPVNPPRTLVSVPLFHVTGEVPLLLNSFVIGRGMVIMPKWDAGEALRLIEKEKITYFVGVPTMSLELMNHPDREKYDLTTLNDITGGGAPRPVSHVERLQKSFPTSQPALGYGLTETNAVGCGNYWSNYAAKPNSTGRSLPFVDVAILGEGDAHLPAGERGEVGIRAAANIRGYWRNEAATRALFSADHYVRTGDIGFLDEDGYLFIVDRKKDIIIRGGENIAAAEVEAALYACPDVAEAAVFGVPDERLGEVPVAILYPRDGSALDEEKLRAFLGGRLAAFKIPAVLRFEPAPLPRLGTGKIDRVSLKLSFLAG